MAAAGRMEGVFRSLNLDPPRVHLPPAPQWAQRRKRSLATVFAVLCFFVLCATLVSRRSQSQPAGAIVEAADEPVTDATSPRMLREQQDEFDGKLEDLQLKLHAIDPWRTSVRVVEGRVLVVQALVTDEHTRGNWTRHRAQWIHRSMRLPEQAQVSAWTTEGADGERVDLVIRVSRRASTDEQPPPQKGMQPFPVRFDEAPSKPERLFLEPTLPRRMSANWC